LRLTASAGLVHPFCVGAASASTRKQTLEELDFKPEVKEQGANAGIDKRRKELVGRLEEACGDGGKPALFTWKDLRKKNKYALVQKQNDKTSVLEWFSEARANEFNLHDHKDARPYVDDAHQNAETSATDIKKTLEEHGIPTDGFGKGKAKSLEEFVLEVQRGASRLMLDATQHKRVVRVVDLVLLRITFMTRSGNVKYLINTAELFPDGRGRTDIYQLPGTKKEPYENSMETAERIIRERMQISACELKFDFSCKEEYEEKTDSASYPGIHTIYHTEIFEVVIAPSTEPATLQRIGIQGGSGRMSTVDSKGYNRTYNWLTLRQCQERNIRLKVEKDSREISALVFAPVGVEEEELHEFLQNNGVDVTKFGEGKMKAFSDELVKGEAALVPKPDKTMQRVVDIVILKVMRGTEVLVETQEIIKGNSSTLNWLPAVKRRPDENMYLAARRCLKSCLGISENAVLFNTSTVLIAEEEKESQTFPGLPSLYRKRIITGNLVREESGLSLLRASALAAPTCPHKQPMEGPTQTQKKSANSDASLTVPGTVDVEDFA